MQTKTTQIIVGRKELMDIYKGKEAQIQARILKTDEPDKIGKGITAMLNRIIKRRYLEIGG